MCPYFLAIGNPRGNENAFLLTMGIFWFRVHNWWAMRIREFERSHGSERAENDEFLFNRARIFTIATYQVRVYNRLPRCLTLYSNFSGLLYYLYQFLYYSTSHIQSGCHCFWRQNSVILLIIHFHHMLQHLVTVHTLAPQLVTTPPSTLKLPTSTSQLP